MDRVSDPNKTRRRFLQMLTTSPFLAGSHLFGRSFLNLVGIDTSKVDKVLGAADSL